MEAIPYALVRDNVVVNIAMAENADAFDEMYDAALPAAPHTAVGDVLQNGVLPGPAPEQTLEEARAVALQAIVAGANKAKAALAARFSDIEERTWPRQEAGARVILGTESEVKDVTARLILANEESKELAVQFVKQLADADGTSAAVFAAKIAANADQADDLGTLTLLEQRGLESRANMAASVAELRGLNIRYSVLS